jgi:hypothetical protein
MARKLQGILSTAATGSRGAARESVAGKHPGVLSMAATCTGEAARE